MELKEASVTLNDFDDGHTPGSTDVGTKLATYNNKKNSNFLSFYDNLLPAEWCSRIYNYALEKNRPWGVYISTRDALNYTGINAEDFWETSPEYAIALIAVRSLLFERGKGQTQDDYDIIAGTCVWCLSSSSTNSVQYHVDYAELYRYETNIIYPPLYAGTCHVSPVMEGDIEGGDFKVNTSGLNHYKKFGYKGKLQGEKGLEMDFSSSDWTTIRYKQNRGILHDGDFPHLSTEVKYLKPGLKRVILGFNCFPVQLEECCARAPEHSDAFNRTIKLYQTMASLGLPSTIKSSSKNILTNDNELPPCPENSKSESDNPSTSIIKPKGISAKDVLKNPALARLLIAAAKRVKESKSDKIHT